MIGRRSFLIAFGWMIAGFTTAKASVSETAPAASPPAPAETGKAPDFALRIQGWDTPVPGEGADGQVWISVGRSWRAAWR